MDTASCMDDGIQRVDCAPVMASGCLSICPDLYGRNGRSTEPLPSSQVLFLRGAPGAGPGGVTQPPGVCLQFRHPARAAARPGLQPRAAALRPRQQRPHPSGERRAGWEKRTHTSHYWFTVLLVFYVL